MGRCAIGKELPVNALPSYDIDITFIVILKRLKRLLQAVADHCALYLILHIMGQDNIYPVSKGLSSRQSLQGPAPHDHHLAGRLLKEHLPVGRNRHQWPAVLADGPMPVRCHAKIQYPLTLPFCIF